MRVVERNKGRWRCPRLGWLDLPSLAGRNFPAPPLVLMEQRVQGQTAARVEGAVEEDMALLWGRVWRMPSTFLVVVEEVAWLLPALRSRHAFNVDPRSLAAEMARGRRAGYRLVGDLHTHLGVPPYPSDTDLNCWSRSENIPGFVHAILETTKMELALFWRAPNQYVPVGALLIVDSIDRFLCSRRRQIRSAPSPEMKPTLLVRLRQRIGAIVQLMREPI